MPEKGMPGARAGSRGPSLGLATGERARSGVGASGGAGSNSLDEAEQIRSQPDRERSERMVAGTVQRMLIQRC